MSVRGDDDRDMTVSHKGADVPVSEASQEIAANDPLSSLFSTEAPPTEHEEISPFPTAVHPTQEAHLHRDVSEDLIRKLESTNSDLERSNSALEEDIELGVSPVAGDSAEAAFLPNFEADEAAVPPTETTAAVHDSDMFGSWNEQPTSDTPIIAAAAEPQSEPAAAPASLNDTFADFGAFEESAAALEEPPQTAASLEPDSNHTSAEIPPVEPFLSAADDTAVTVVSQSSTPTVIDSMPPPSEETRSLSSTTLGTTQSAGNEAPPSVPEELPRSVPITFPAPEAAGKLSYTAPASTDAVTVSDVGPTVPADPVKPVRALGPDEKVVASLIAEITGGSDSVQKTASEQLKDLVAAKLGYREALVSVGGLNPLLELLAEPKKAAALFAAQALAAVASSASCRPAIRESGAVALFIATLVKGQGSIEGPLVDAILGALAAVARDDPGRIVIQEAGGVPLIIKLMDGPPDVPATRSATELVGQLAHTEEIKDAIRDSGGILALMRQLKQDSATEGVLEVVTRALTMLTINNKTNQDYVRTIDGLKPLVRMLEWSSTPAVVAAALDALRAICVNNDENKAKVSTSWLVPQLVKLMGSQERMEIIEKAVDCLRIVTTGSDANKRALVEITIAVPTLVNLLSDDPSQVITERAVAVLGNLSTSSEYFQVLREAGAMQRLVHLLDCGSDSRITEICAKTLANLGSQPNNRTFIRLAGGIPPLVSLLFDQSSPAVMNAAEQALRQLQVSDVERNAILEAFRYKEGKMAAAVNAANARADAVVDEAAAKVVEIGVTPFTRYTVREVAALMEEVGFPAPVAAAFQTAGLTGGDVLDLDEQDMTQDLGLSRLQAKKVRGIQAAFKLFNRIMRVPGRGELTMVELRDFLTKVNLEEDTVLTILGGLKDVLGNDGLAVLNFLQFTLVFQWLSSTVEAYGSKLA